VKKAVLALCVGLTAGCSVFGPSRPSGTIVVPPPASPQAEPSGLAQVQPNTNHIHAMATRGGAGYLLLATHAGVSGLKQGASPAPLGGSAPRGDVLQVAYAADGAAYAAGHNLGVQVSHDDGAAWALVSPDVAGLDVHGLAVDPHNPRALYVYAVGRGILVSADGGGHWEHRAGWADSHYLTGITVTADGTLLGGSPELGIVASTDRGSNFVGVRSGTGQIFCVSASATSPDVVLAATENGIFLTTNGGKDWQVGGTDVPVTALLVDPKDVRRFYAGAADGTIFTSPDQGTTWQPL
jgi:hypothetical protein